MLRRDTFTRVAEHVIEAQVLAVIYDFLTDRRCRVEVGKTLSREYIVPLGCVQGSVLGPKLFSIYTRNIPHYLSPSATVTIYADDSYVIISAPEGRTEDLVKETKECLANHTQYLKDLGMVVNCNKTEMMYINRSGARTLEIDVEGVLIRTLPSIKVLGVHLDSRMTWSTHISKTINKMNQLIGSLRFVRRRLTKSQFLKVLTSQYYGTCYYACQAWLGPHTRKMDLRKLNSMHYKLLRISEYDWKNKIKRDELDKIGRARPSLWGKYATISMVIKTLRDEQPKRINDHLLSTLYYERRREGFLKFYDKSRTKFGRQAVGNRITVYFEELNQKFHLTESNDQIRRTLKRALCFAQANDGTRQTTSTVNSRWHKSDIRIGEQAEDIDDLITKMTTT
jgi:hypothetical protein